MLLTIVAGLAGFLVLWLTPSSYTVEVRFTEIAESGRSQPLSQQERNEPLASHARALLDPDLLFEAAKSTDTRSLVASEQGILEQLWAPLAGQATTTRGESPEDADSRADGIARLLARMSVRSDPQAGTLSLSLTASDASAATAFLNALAKTYLVRTSRRDEAARLAQRVDREKAEAVRSEGAAQAARELTDRMKAAGEDAAALEAEVASLAAELKDAEELDQRIRTQGRFVREDLAQRSGAAGASSPPSLKDLLDEQARLEKQLAAGQAGGGDEMLRLKALRQQIAREFARLSPLLEAQAEATGKLVALLRQRVEEVTRRAAAARSRESEVEALAQTAMRQRAEADRHMEELKALSEQDWRPAGTLRLAGPAQVEALPGPRRGPIVLSLMALALLTGVIVVTLRELLRRGPARAPWPSVSRVPDPEPVVILGGDRFAAISSLRAAAALLLVRSELHRGFRVLITAETPEVAVDEDAQELVRALTEADRRVVLVRWSLQGSDLAGGAASRASPGLNDLIVGTRTFEEIVRSFDGTAAHVIEAGATVTDRSAALEPNRLNMVFDALDEAYDTIVVAASHDEARELFAALEGRFDACLSVAAHESAEGDASPFEARPGAFLGFEVSDIDIIRYRRPVDSGSGQAEDQQMAEARVA